MQTAALFPCGEIRHPHGFIQQSGAFQNGFPIPLKEEAGITLRPAFRIEAGGQKADRSRGMRMQNAFQIELIARRALGIVRQIQGLAAGIGEEGASAHAFRDQPVVHSAEDDLPCVAPGQFEESADGEVMHLAFSVQTASGDPEEQFSEALRKRSIPEQRTVLHDFQDLLQSGSLAFQRDSVRGRRSSS